MKLADVKLAEKTIAQDTFGEVSRRTLLTAGLAGGFLLAFHLPVRAANEPIQPPDVTDGRFAPNAFSSLRRSILMVSGMVRVSL